MQDHFGSSFIFFEPTIICRNSIAYVNYSFFVHLVFLIGLLCNILDFFWTYS